MINPWLGIGLFLALLFGMLSVLRLFLRSTAHPEVVRKTFHIGMGLGTLPFPWIFSTAWPVLFLLSVSLLLLWGMRRPGWLHNYYGGILESVTRPSWGEFYFPIGVATVFLLSHGETQSFLIPILLLTLADAAAALVGLRFGKHRYATGGGEKSIEGSLACFLVAMLCTFLPLRFLYGMELRESLLIGLNVGALVMLLEALTWGGLDNLLIPVIGCVFLQSLLERNILGLSLQLIALIVLNGVLFGSVVNYQRRGTSIFRRNFQSTARPQDGWRMAPPRRVVHGPEEEHES